MAVTIEEKEYNKRTKTELQGNEFICSRLVLIDFAISGEINFSIFFIF